MQRTRRKLQLSEVSPHLKCVLCGGYFIDATTIVECLHSFCRSCLIKYLRNNSFCPICDVQIHKTKPFLNIKPDKTLQDIVYKLVPGLFHIEMRRRRQFYSKHPEQLSLTRPEERGVGVERIIYSADDSFSLSLEYYDAERAREDWRCDSSRSSESGTTDTGPATEHSISTKRYLRCPALVTIAILKKFIILKYDLRKHHKVDVIYRRESLADDYTLMDVAYIYTWKRSGPMRFFYHITDTKLEPMSVAKDSVTTHAVQDKSSQDVVTSSGIHETLKPVSQERAQFELTRDKAARTAHPQPETPTTTAPSTVPTNQKTAEAGPKLGTARTNSATTEKQNHPLPALKKCAVPQPSKPGSAHQLTKKTDIKVESSGNEVKSGSQLPADVDAKSGGGNEVDAVKSGGASSSNENKTTPISQNVNAARLTKSNELAKGMLARQEENAAKLNVAISVLSNGFVVPKNEIKADVGALNPSNSSNTPLKLDADGGSQGRKNDTGKNAKSLAMASLSKVVPTVKPTSDVGGDSMTTGATSNGKRQELKSLGNKESADNTNGRAKLVPTNKIMNDVHNVKPPIENPNQQILTKNDEIIATPNVLKRQQCFNESFKRKMQNNETGKSYLGMNRLTTETNKTLIKKVRLLKQESIPVNTPLKRPHEASKVEAEPSIKKTRVEKDSVPSALHKVRITKSKPEVVVNGDVRDRPVSALAPVVPPDTIKKEVNVDKCILQNNKTIEKVKKSFKNEPGTKVEEPKVGALESSVPDIKSGIKSKSATQNVMTDTDLKKADIKKNISDVNRNSADFKVKSVDKNQKHLGGKVKNELPDKSQTLQSGGKKNDSNAVIPTMPQLLDIPKLSEKKMKVNVKSVGHPSLQNIKQEINKDVRPSPKHDRIGALDLTSSRSQPHSSKKQPPLTPAPPLSPLSPLSAFPLMSLPLRSPPPQLKIPNVSRLPQQRPSSLSSSSPSPPADSRSPRMGTSPTQTDFRSRLSASPQGEHRRGSRGPTSPGTDRLVPDDLGTSRMGPPPELASTAMRQQLEMHARLWGAVAMNPDFFQSQQLKQMEALALMRTLGRGSVPPNSTCNRKT